jgi:hypothetical protein
VRERERERERERKRDKLQELRNEYDEKIRVKIDKMSKMKSKKCHHIMYNDDMCYT